MRLSQADLQSMGYGLDGQRLRTRGGGQPSQVGAAREADLHDAILAHCRAHGWPVVHSRMDVPQTAGIGTPDFVVALPGGRTAWVEAKAVGGKVRPEQAAWMAALRAQGHRAEIVRSLSEFLQIVQTP